MRVDAAGARTWLLAAVAGWAVLAWVLAVFGMGGRIAPLADDPGLIKPIPTLPARSASRLGPITQYAEIGARPLFATDRRPKPFSLLGEGEGAEATQEFDYLLTSVLITPDLRLAMLQSPDGSKSERVKVGEAPAAHPAWRLSALNARSAVFDGPNAQRTIELRVFDGIGGQPPTTISREGQPPGTGAIPVPVAPPSNGNGSPPKPATRSSQPTAAVPPGATKPEPTAPATSAPPVTEQAQMEAIRQRIQARRAQLRQQSQPTQPPVQDR